jgi:hypothetical protein
MTGWAIVSSLLFVLSVACVMAALIAHQVARHREERRVVWVSAAGGLMSFLAGLWAMD